MTDAKSRARPIRTIVTKTGTTVFGDSFKLCIYDTPLITAIVEIYSRGGTLSYSYQFQTEQTIEDFMKQYDDFTENIIVLPDTHLDGRQHEDKKNIHALFPINYNGNRSSLAWRMQRMPA